MSFFDDVVSGVSERGSQIGGSLGEFASSVTQNVLDRIDPGKQSSNLSAEELARGRTGGSDGQGSNPQGSGVQFTKDAMGFSVGGLKIGLPIILIGGVVLFLALRRK